MLPLFWCKLCDVKFCSVSSFVNFLFDFLAISLYSIWKATRFNDYYYYIMNHHVLSHFSWFLSSPKLWILKKQTRKKKKKKFFLLFNSNAYRDLCCHKKNSLIFHCNFLINKKKECCKRDWQKSKSKSALW